MQAQSHMHAALISHTVPILLAYVSAHAAPSRKLTWVTEEKTGKCQLNCLFHIKPYFNQKPVNIIINQFEHHHQPVQTEHWQDTW